MRAGRTVAPFNEPSTIYWWAGNNQEGCHFDAATQNLIIERLAARLREGGLAAAGVEVSASDETSIDSALLTLRGYSPGAEAALTQINTHSVRPPTPRSQHCLVFLVLRAGRHLVGGAMRCAIQWSGCSWTVGCAAAF